MKNLPRFLYETKEAYKRELEEDYITEYYVVTQHLSDGTIVVFERCEHRNRPKFDADGLLVY